MRSLCQSCTLRGNRSSWRTIVFALVSASVILGAAFVERARAQEEVVQPAEKQVVEIPDTPVGEHMRWFLDAIAETNPPSADEVERRFSPEFLEQIPANAVIAITKTLRMQLGAVVLENIEARDDSTLIATLFSAKNDQSFALVIVAGAEAPHQITGLNVRPLPKKPKEGDTWDDIDTALEEIASDVAIGAYVVRDNGALLPVHMLNEGAPLATGSAFKLWVLAALADQVRDGRLRFDDTLAVREEWKSLPGGTMQNEANGTEHPLSHYANQMISISDNTATDHLIHTIGRERVEEAMARWCAEPERNIPFVTTRELFTLKLNSDASLPQRYIDADTEGKRALLDGEIAEGSPNIAMASFWVVPRMIDTLEWFASAEELSQTIADLSRMGSSEDGMEPIMAALSINPGIPLDREVWAGFAYKGGSEPGVMNMTFWLLRQDGKQFALSVSANDTMKNLEQIPMVAIVERAIGMLAKESPGGR
jgi:beta-lactamase class A